jgi:hypothetical protein
MQLDPSIVSALSALLGSVVGGSATISAAWLTQKTQSERERIGVDARRREQLYAEFVSECSKLIIDSLDHTLDDPAKLQEVYALQNRVRLIGTDPVDRAADETVRRIVTQYLKPNLTSDEVQQVALSHQHDPLRPFAEACREELKAMWRAS